MIWTGPLDGANDVGGDRNVGALVVLDDGNHGWYNDRNRIIAAMHLGGG